MHSNRPFTVKDGRGAEVQVQTGNAAVKSIHPDAKGVNASVEFNFDGMLTYKVSGWIPMSEPVFKKLEASLANGTEVEYRLESQRRPNVSADISFDELRKDASNTLRKLLVYVDGDYTKEAVTLQENDPMSSDRVRQQPGQRFGGEHEEALLAGSVDPSTALSTLRTVVENKSFDETVISALIAQALLAGVSESDIWEATAGKDRRTDEKRETVRQSFSPESPGWSEFNKDGRPNLGSLSVQAGVGVEKFVRSAEGSRGGDENQVRIFSDLILAIADRVQEGAYGTGFRIDRSASSHSIIRGLVYDTISEHNLSIPFNQPLDTIKGWVSSLGSTVRNRFNVALAVSDARRKFTDIYADYEQSVLGGASAPAPARPQDESHPVTRPAERTAPLPEPQRSRESQSPNEQRSRDWAEPAEKSIAPVIEEATETTEAEPESPSEPVESSSQPQSRPAPSEAPEEAPAAAEEASKPAAFGIAGLSVGVPATAKTAPAREPNYAVDEPTVTADEGDSEEELEIFEPVDVAEAIESGDTTADVAEQSTIQALTSLVKKAGVTDNSQVTGLLRYTYGADYQKSTSIPDGLLLDMVDFYTVAGPDNFRAVLARIAAGAE